MFPESNPQRTRRIVWRTAVSAGIATLTLLAIWIFGSNQRGSGQAAALRASRHVSSLETTAEETASWPQWRGLKRDGVSDERGFLKDWAEYGPNILWTNRTTGPGYSGLAIAGGRLYTLMQDGESEAVVCWTADSGEEIWRHRYPAKFVNDQGSGPRSTPTVDSNRVYSVGATGILHCLNATTGEIIWRRDLVNDLSGDAPDWGVSFAPLIDGDLLFTLPGGAAGSSLAAFDKFTGELRWQSLNDRPGYSSPMISTAAGVRQVLFFTGEALVSVAPEDGRLYWRYPWSTTMDCNVATPIVDRDHIFISSGYGRGCALLKIVAEGAGALRVEETYTQRHMSNHFSTSVLYKGHLYGFDDAVLVCMELHTGHVKWQTRGFRKGSLIIADDHLIILGENGKLALAEATPAEYREKAALRISPYRCWTLPTLAGGRLYVRDQQQITCLDLRASQKRTRTDL